MKAFYEGHASHAQASDPSLGVVCAPGSDHSPSRPCARVAVYEATGAAPRVIDVPAAPPGEFIEAVASNTYELARAQGGRIPYTVIREVSENLIHADFREPVVSILDGGRTIRFADQGPGIAEKDKAQQPGFTTATHDMKAFIRGVGSGLPIVRDYLSVSGGSLEIEDNLGSGTVVTVTERSLPAREPFASRDVVAGSVPVFATPADSLLAEDFAPLAPPVASPRLTTRQKQALALVMENGNAGPSLVSRELNVGVSTAYRDLAALEEAGLIYADGGKRHLSEAGIGYLDDLTGSM